MMMLLFTVPLYLLTVFNSPCVEQGPPGRKALTAEEENLVGSGFKLVQEKYDVIHRAYAKASPRGFEVQTREFGKNDQGVEYGASGMVAVNTGHDDAKGMIKSAGECLKEKDIHDRVVQMIKDSSDKAV